MKILSALALGAAVLLMSGASFAENAGYRTGGLHRSSAACNAFENAVPVWKYSSAAHRMVFAGYECDPVPGGH